ERFKLGTGTGQAGQVLADQRDDVDRVLDGGKGSFGMSGHRGLLDCGLRPGSMVYTSQRDRSREGVRSLFTGPRHRGLSSAAQRNYNSARNSVKFFRSPYDTPETPSKPARF